MLVEPCITHLKGEQLESPWYIDSECDGGFDLVAEDAWPQFLDVLRPKGRYAVSGAIGGAMVELDVRTLYLKGLSFFGCTVIEPEVFRNLVTRIEQNDIKPLVAKSFKLQDIQQAQAFFLEKSHVGKVVLTLE